MMSDRRFAGLLRRAARVSALNMAIGAEVTDAFRERYGTTHSDVDADEIIESLDYGGSPISLADVDRIMAEAGFPKDTSPNCSGAD